jgi:hypothetical protein
MPTDKMAQRGQEKNLARPRERADRVCVVVKRVREEPAAQRGSGGGAAWRSQPGG